MRLGAPILSDILGPGDWIQALQRRGYRAANCPLDSSADAATIRAYEQAAHGADILIAEVGAWSNPLSPDEVTRRAAVQHCQEQLALADVVGARCCVNIAGSRGARWDGPHADNFTPDTFDLIVETVRMIIDAVEPQRTFYTLEPMPWMYPDSAESYLRLIQAIDRERFAVHLDPVNMINSPRRFYENAGLIRDCFERLGPFIKSCHAKDIQLSDELTVHLYEVRPGLGELDYRVYLEAIEQLDRDMPIMLEHLGTEEDYDLSADYIRGIADRIGVGY